MGRGYRKSPASWRAASCPSRFPWGKSSRSRCSSPTRRRPRGGTTAFAGLRDYLAGDDVRRINWKATSRRDNPVVMEVEAERGQQAIIALDCGRLMTAPAGYLTKLDHAINAALLLAWVAQSQGDKVGMLTFSDGVRRFG